MSTSVLPFVARVLNGMTFKIVIKSKFGTLSIKLGYKPINCVGVQTFEIDKFLNVEISHSFMP